MKKTIIIVLTIITIFSSFVKSQNIDLYPIENNGVYYYRNSKGKIYNTKFTSARKFSEGLAAVETKSKFGYINSKVKFVIKPQYEAAGDFKEGLAFVKLNDKYGFINKKGEVIIDFKYDYAGNFKDGFTIVKNIRFNTSANHLNTKVGVIDINDKLLGNKWFSYVSEFKNGYYLVNIDKDFFKLYRNGTIEDIKEYSDDLALNSNYIDKQPEYPGGKDALLKFISSHVKYPDAAREKGIQGVVSVQFEISKTGKVENVKVPKSIDPLLDKAAIKVVEQMGNWEPGMHKEQVVRSVIMVPIVFRYFRL